ncbi:hypothetical protein ACFQPA_21865 [Halomarina halobia]|uniref:DksA C4-type domain-containing protein n=1 Tax=Halomarina halobia TaxID=3033386 RepID=A0ABD6AH22_9EURY|nr:hypothetical protein [Halomarina sp. PSR21]
MRERDMGTGASVMFKACDACGEIKEDVRRVRVEGETLRRALCPDCRSAEQS